MSQHRYYLKVDNNAIPLSSSCLAEAFWVFNVEYPSYLQIFHYFIIFLMGIDKIKIGLNVYNFFTLSVKLCLASQIWPDFCLV
jgi:hypothetical protein